MGGDSLMPSDSWRDRLRAEIIAELNKYTDGELVQVAWMEFEDWDAPPDPKGQLLRDLQEAEQQLQSTVVLSREGRRRMKMFLYNKKKQDGETKRRRKGH
jgi:hypothetical protein